MKRRPAERFDFESVAVIILPQLKALPTGPGTAPGSCSSDRIVI